MSIKNEYSVHGVDLTQYKEWLLKKHYAHRIPSISYAFGLFDSDNILQGVCTLGTPVCPSLNMGKCIFNNYLIKTLELNRLVVNDNLHKNSLSIFVGMCLKLLPKPLCLISFADPNNNHCGYIYQATNWIYTGMSSRETSYILGNTQIHSRNLNKHWFLTNGFKYDDNLTVRENFTLYCGDVINELPKYRYLMFLGTKNQKKEMMSKLKYKILPYPKGVNKRYDTSFEPTIQYELF